ncbi:hypothetical protein GCM10009734_91730 [Nonomuraea bangladeshensis]
MTWMSKPLSFPDAPPTANPGESFVTPTAIVPERSEAPFPEDGGHVNPELHASRVDSVMAAASSL